MLILSERKPTTEKHKKGKLGKMYSNFLPNGQVDSLERRQDARKAVKKTRTGCGELPDHGGRFPGCH
jgi:hypothetical protein